MALTKHETQVTWDTGNNSDSVSAGGNVTSDEINLDATCISAQISLKADNSTTPAADDIIHFYILQTSGDPDGASTDEFDTVNHAQELGVLDTNSEDPALVTVPLPIPQKGFTIYAEGATEGSTNAITVSATITEQRSSS